MNTAEIPATNGVAEFVKRCGSKRLAAKLSGIPRKTLCRWLLDIEQTGKIRAHPMRIAVAQERIQRALGALHAQENAYDVGDALMGVFGYHRAGRGDDMQSASFPDSLSDATGKVTGQKQGQYFLKSSDNVNHCGGMNGEKTRTRTRTNPSVVLGPVDDCDVIFNGGPVPDAAFIPGEVPSEYTGAVFTPPPGTNIETGRRVTGNSVHGSRIVNEKARKRRTVLFLYDIHLPNQSDENIELALDYAQTRHEIDTVVLGGDFLDCAGISRWKKDPYGTMPLHEEIARGVAWLEMLRKRFGSANVVYVKGNHEDRLQSYLWNQAAEISKLKGLKLQDQLELDRIGIEWVDNLERIERGHGAYSIGKLNILHGHELGICPAVDCARKYFFKALENIIVGHVHKRDEHTEPTLNDTKGAWVVGHLQDEHPAYRPFNKWVAGFALGSFDDDGLFSIKNKKIIQRRVL